MKPCLLMRRAGPSSTVQDLGRQGVGRLGVSPAGAMDPLLLRAANVAVDNPQGTACIEWTVQAGCFEVQAESARLAVTGDCAIAIDGVPAAPWRSHLLRRGQQIDIAARGDLRGYVAVFGGFDIAPVLGSLSTHVRSGLGGWQGRALRDGDMLPLLCERVPAGRPPRPLDLRALTPPPAALRIVWGPQDDAFRPEARDLLVSTPWQVSAHSDRMACTLSGPRLGHVHGADIVSDGVVCGSIQVLGSGVPTVLLADRQTTGGYAKIATLISADLRHAAQWRPGATLRLVAVGQDEALAALIAQEARFARHMGLAEGTLASPLADAEVLGSANLVSGVADAADVPNV